jgi:ABC-type antimicrobial peptide transport system permease subunit
MSALILFGIAVPVALILSVWSDVRSIEETINKRKHHASLLSMPGDYHTVRKED